MKNDVMKILLTARATLVKRIAMRVEEAGEEFIDSLTSDSFSLISDDILDLGERLNKLNILLNAMEQDYKAELTVEQTPVSPYGYETYYCSVEPAPALDTYLYHVKTGDLLSAANVLANLLNIDQPVAHTATAFFCYVIKEDPYGEEKFRGLKSQARISTSRSLERLHELFGFRGDTAIKVHTLLREMV